MRQVERFQELIADGVWYAGSNWLYAVCSPTWHAYALWGALSEQDVAALTTLFVELEATQTPHAVLADVRHLRNVTPAAFLTLTSYVSGHSEALARLIPRAWILHDASLIGAVAAGFFSIQTPPFPVHTTSDAAIVCADLRLPRATWKAYEQTLAEARSDDGFLGALEAGIWANTERPTLDAIARAMSMSPRSLQRRLHTAKTTLAREIARVRVHRARVLLSTTSASITELALSLGFSTPEHFSTTFRDATGETPSAYRARTNGASP